MANLKEVRNRISSVGSTMQITSAMKMVSAAKLKRAQDAVVQLRPYATKLRGLLVNLSSNSDSGSVFSKKRDGKNILLIAVSSNRGLAGAFNSTIIKKVWSLVNNEYKDSKITILCVGKKANDIFRKTEYHIGGTDLPHHLNELFDGLNFEKVVPVVDKIMGAYSSGQFDQVHLIYNQFKNAAVQICNVESFLPVQSTDAPEHKIHTDYIHEPAPETMVERLIPKMLRVQFYKALLDSVASEHGARMTAMHKATDNARDMLKELKISYNKVRQAAITKEILEIVGGAEALSS